MYQGSVSVNRTTACKSTSVESEALHREAHPKDGSTMESNELVVGEYHLQGPVASGITGDRTGEAPCALTVRLGKRQL